MNEQPHRGSPRTVALLACGAAAVYLVLALSDDLRRHSSVLLAGHLAGTGLMLAAFHVVGESRRALRLALVAALAFRLILVAAPPSLSDDVYRYVWDGRVQLAGIHPYRHAPDDPALASLRDADWARINHPELRTIYPPVAQACFAALAALGAGTRGFKLAAGVADAAVALLLLGVLRRHGLPARRVLLYAWNPLAILESAGSGHVDALGVLLLLAGWSALEARRPLAAPIGLAAAVHVKLLPLVLLPAALGRVSRRHWPIWAACLALPLLPLALLGPAVGAGLFAYAGRWEHNATIYAAVEAAWAAIDPAPVLGPWLDGVRARTGGPAALWELAYRSIWPRELARLVVAAAAVVWIARLRRRPPARALVEPLLVTGGVLLLSPTLHPWYLLWVLPWAAARASAGWLVLAATMPLSYLAAGDPPLGLKLAVFAPALLAAAWAALRARRAC